MADSFHVFKVAAARIYAKSNRRRAREFESIAIDIEATAAAAATCASSFTDRRASNERRKIKSTN